MGINNSSGRPVEYEVEPSNPGVGAPILVSAALTGAGTAFTALGCLTEFEPDLTLVGLFLLVGALIADIYAYSKVSSAGASLGAGGGSGGKVLLADGATDPHVLQPGTWVVFTEVGKPDVVIAVSPPIFDTSATVSLRRCVDSASLPPEDKDSLMARSGQDHVEVT